MSDESYALRQSQVLRICWVTRVFRCITWIVVSLFKLPFLPIFTAICLLFAELLHLSFSVFCYNYAIKKAVSKTNSKTNGIKLFYCTSPQKVSRLVKETLSSSTKKFKNYVGSIWCFIHHYNKFQ